VPGQRSSRAFASDGGLDQVRDRSRADRGFGVNGGPDRIGRSKLDSTEDDSTHVMRTAIRGARKRPVRNFTRGATARRAHSPEGLRRAQSRTAR